MKSELCLVHIFWIRDTQPIFFKDPQDLFLLVTHTGELEAICLTRVAPIYFHHVKLKLIPFDNALI